MIRNVPITPGAMSVNKHLQGRRQEQTRFVPVPSWKVMRFRLHILQRQASAFVQPHEPNKTILEAHVRTGNAPLAWSTRPSQGSGQNIPLLTGRPCASVSILKL